MNKHVMIDLETMGLHNRAPILSIGAVVFDAAAMHERFYMAVDLQSNIDVGRTPDAGTIMFWMNQPQEVRATLFDGAVPLVEAIDAFERYLKDFAGEDYRIWANGSMQDTLWLQTAFQDVGLPVPWGFRQPACYRTIRDSYPPVQIENIGMAHNALDDAMFQTKYLQTLNDHYKLDIL